MYNQPRSKDKAELFKMLDTLNIQVRGVEFVLPEVAFIFSGLEGDVAQFMNMQLAAHPPIQQWKDTSPTRPTVVRFFLYERQGKTGVHCDVGVYMYHIVKS